MKKLFAAAILFLALCVISFRISNEFFPAKKGHQIQQKMPLPQEGEENEKLRERYNELRHQAAPGISWRSVEELNAQAAATAKLTGTNSLSFANGNIFGDWSEKGSNNVTGSVRAVDYSPATNTLYTISNGGSLWTSVLGTGVWTLRNQNQQFEQRAIKVFNNTSGGQRLLLASGTGVYYSDNNGQTLNPSSGIIFPVAWGGNYVAGFYRIADGTIYCLTRLWSDVPFTPRFRLYRSLDQGQTYAMIYQFDTGDDGTLSLCNPYNSSNIYLTDVGSTPGSIKFFSVSGSTVSLINTYIPGTTISTCVLKGTVIGGASYLYLMLNNNQVYASNNFGAVWTFKSSLPENAWDKMNVSINDATKVSFGGVNAFRSSNSGSSFTKVNDWSEYYGNISGKLHADIMEIEYFKKADNTEFAIIDCHGGTFISYDNLVTVSNLSLNGHIAVEYYDVLTDTINQNRIFGGSQDQGIQRTLTGLNAGPQNFLQMISGDYGQLSLTANNAFLWPQYPGGDYYLFTDLGAVSPQYIGNWTTPGTEKPNYGWMLAATSTANKMANEIWIGGGNLTGGGGSYLIKASMEATTPYGVTATQFSYNFRANSRTTTAGITAIEQSLINPNKIFVAAEDGTFFYSNNLGTTWNKTNSFTGPYPWYLYGSCILASKLNDNRIWYCGSGYSNPGVYKSTDGGVTFSPMSTGLPSTLVNEIVASPDERFIFAATEAGPYVYVTSENIWYSLANNTMPTQFFSGVEYITAQNVVRFSTMGRGIWDFKITGTVPVLLTKWQANKQGNDVLCSWQTQQEINTSHFDVERSLNGIDFTVIGQVTATGNSSSPRNYSFTDKFPRKGINYYRLKTADLDNNNTLSSTIAVNIVGGVKSLFVYPNPAKDILFVEASATIKEKIQITITDLRGTKVIDESQTINGQAPFLLNIASLPNGMYIIRVTGKTFKESQRFVKM